jgi:murein DD-endopeptidase MepM/ murein hydrolase activator NlpD
MGRGPRTYLVAACLALVAPAAAHAQAVAPSSPAASSPATVAKLDCAGRCGTGGAVRPGSLLRVRGKGMSRADEVVFLGAEGVEDDVTATAVARRRSSVDVRVPLGAAAGPVAVVDRDRALSSPSPGAIAVEPTPASAVPSVDAAVNAPRAFVDSAQPPVLTYVVHGPGPAQVAIQLVRETDGVVLLNWDAPQVAPEAIQRLAWDGRVNGRVQVDGRYAFRVMGAGLVAAVASFELSREKFPILGRYSFGSGSASFGGGRGHQGHDVFARCGTPLVAARGGTVKFSGYHGRAGNYLVIETEEGPDHAYMHLRDEPLVAEGDRVQTGQPIGHVGLTGSASACHLHFEIWSAPGWYDGGRPIDPLPTLRSWAAQGRPAGASKKR